MIGPIALIASFVWHLAPLGYAATATAPAMPPVDARWREAPGTDTVFKPAEFKTLQEWRDRRAWLAEQVRFAAGLLPEPPRTPLNAQIFGKREYDGYTIEKVYFESRPGFYVIGNLYRPARIEGQIPAVACALGHWAHGRMHQDNGGNHPALALTLAKLGAAVFVYDMTGYNEGEQQIRHGINTPELDLWGITSFQLQTWNSVRVIDFLQSLPEVDPQRIGMTGASGGGTQTFILSTIDDRVKVACPVNMISCSMQGGCICENAPGLRIGTNNMEFGACMAPRPMLMVSASGDWTTRTPQVEYPFIRGIYELYGQAERVQNAHVTAGHNYNQASREAMYRFFGKWLLNRSDADALCEGSTPKFEPQDLMVWTDKTTPKNLLTFDKLVPRFEDQARRQIEELAPTKPNKLEALTALVQTGLMHMLGGPLPTAKDLERTGVDRPGQVVRYERGGQKVEGAVWAAGDGKSTGLILRAAWPVADDSGKKASVPAGWELVNLSAFAPRGHVQPTTATKPGDDPGFFSTFNRVDAAESAFDVQTALTAEMLDDRRPRVGLAAFGEMGPVCLMARALLPKKLVESRGLRTAIDMNGFDVDSDAAYLKELNVPHIRQIGGLQALAAVACNGPIWFHNVGHGFNEDWIKAAAKICGFEVRITRERADEQAVMDWLTK